MLIDRIYKTVFWVYLVESILILIGISIGVVDYGIDVATPLMGIGIFIGLIVFATLRLIINNTNTIVRKIIAITISILMISLCFYYLLEDQFSLSF